MEIKLKIVRIKYFRLNDSLLCARYDKPVQNVQETKAEWHATAEFFKDFISEKCQFLFT
jgi:hypothetical protein